MALLPRNIDQHPTLNTDDWPDDAEFARLALVLLREMAQIDPNLAERMTTLGIE